MPSKSWELDDLVAFAISHGVDFEGCHNITEIRGKFTITEVLKVIYETVEPIEWQNEVEAVRGKKSVSADFTNDPKSKVWKASVIYRGNGFLPLSFEGRTQLFIPGIVYTFGREHKNIADRLNAMPEFEVTWEASGGDSILETMKSADSNVFSDADLDREFQAVLGGK
jgi:hypothetical protein